MTSPKPPLTPAGWKPPRRSRSAVPPRARQLVDLMNFGTPDGSKPPMRRNEAAEHMGIGKAYARQLLAKPGVRQYLSQALEAMREAERPRNLQKAVEIREDEEMDASAAGRRVQIEAMRFIEQRDGPANVNVNVGVGVGITLQPGYAVSIPENYLAGAQAVLRAAGSLASIDAGGERHEVEYVEPIAAPAPPPIERQPSPVERPRGDWGGRLGPPAYPPADSRLRAPPKPGQ